MAAVDAAAVKKLREATSAGIMDCKKALAETNGDFDEAVKFLREKGLQVAITKGGRTAADGRVGVYVSTDGSKAALVEVNCETDFVARNEKYIELSNALAQQAVESGSDDISTFTAQPFQSSGKTVEEHVKESIATLGENIVASRLARFESNGGTIGAYVHTDGKQAALVELQGGSSDAVKELARDIAMQAVALKAPYLNRESVPSDVVEAEKHVYRQQAAGEGKPEAMLDKIAEGRLNKFYQQNTLIEQQFIKDDKKTVQQLLKSTGDVTVARFVRFKVGESS
jgi:elongation factor Ts